MSSNKPSTNPDIERLTREMNRAREKSETWDGRNIKMLIVAGLVAVGLAICGMKVSAWNREVLRTTDELNKEKDRQLKLDLDALDAVSSAAKAEAEKANERAEDLRAKNNELEKSLAPRTLAIFGTGGQSNIDSLRPFAGINVIVETISDAEARRAAGVIISILREAKWNIVGTATNEELETSGYDGVTLRYRTYPGFITPEKLADHSERAAEALLIFLRASDWQRISRHPVFPGQHNELATNTVNIKIGFKPSEYFTPGWVKSTEEKTEQQLGLNQRINDEKQRIEKLRTQVEKVLTRP